MKLSAEIRFWGDGVGCFCHEALVRALREAFGDVLVAETDLAREKYERVADQPALERSAWSEYLRNGPAFAFTLPIGITGRMSRYRIVFDLPEETPADDVDAVRAFLGRLCLGEVLVETSE